jgi:hypothetical protein
MRLNLVAARKEMGAIQTGATMTLPHDQRYDTYPANRVELFPELKGTRAWTVVPLR